METDGRHLLRRLEQARKEAYSARLLLLAARAVVGANLLLIAIHLRRGWHSGDYYYLFTMSIWVGLMILQGRIYAKHRSQVKNLEKLLDIGTRPAETRSEDSPDHEPD